MGAPSVKEGGEEKNEGSFLTNTSVVRIDKNETEDYAARLNGSLGEWTDFFNGSLGEWTDFLTVRWVSERIF